MSDGQNAPQFNLHTNRIEALGDGVFAIVMTLLILEIKVPVLHGEETSKLGRSLLDLWPKFLCYFISFITLGVYWVAHHLHFYTIKKADRGLLWINILFLMALGLVPFSTALIGEYVHERLPVILFGANMIAISLILQWHWSYATANHRLVSPDIDPGFIKAVTRVIMMGPVVYGIAIALAFVSTKIAVALFLLVNLLYIIPGGVHLHLKSGSKTN